MSVEFTKFERQVFLNTVRIENLTDNETGTGFLVGKKVDDKNNRILLFSNKHVFWCKKDKNLKNVTKKVRITLHKSNKDGTVDLGKKVQIEGLLTRDEKKGYFDHPIDEVDVGCANISKWINDELNPYVAVIGDPFFDFDVEKLYPGMDVKFVGYPNGFYDVVNNLPVLRSGTIASIPGVNFMGKPQILIDAQVFPGSSGSPVFVKLEENWKLIGILSSSMYKSQDYLIKEAVSESEGGKIAISWLGLGILFTTENIREVLDMAL